MKRFVSILFLLVLLLSASRARADEVPPFDIDPYNPPDPNAHEQGFCTENWCVGPPSPYHDCGAAYCAWLTQTACIASGFCGGQAGEGRACDFSIECQVPFLQPFELPPGCTDLPCPQPTPPPTEPPPPTPPPPVSCPSPQVIPGEITTSGSKTWPPYPLVVGQDPHRTGVNLTFSASVAPTILRFWTQEPVEECAPGPNANGVYNCGGGTGHKVITGYICEEHTQTFGECIAGATAGISLSQESRDWILNGDLQIRYPGAYLHHPYFQFGGHRSCSWTSTQNRVQVADPGIWEMFLRGRTTGTPVSAPRSFNRTLGNFEVWLKEVVIVK